MWSKQPTGITPQEDYGFFGPGSVARILYAFERFAPGRLTAEEEDPQYRNECAIAAEL